MLGKVLSTLHKVHNPFQQPPTPASGYHDERKRPELGMQVVKPKDKLYGAAQKLSHLFYTPPLMIWKR